ncbi:MAG: 50S ribosomal protein L10 [Saprospiraceae bacterium]|nr:50S ribosomal protein L10 [Saprospiraceae bacterium]
MTRSEKTQVIEDLKSKLADAQYFYITDSSELTVDQVTKLRGLCYEKGVEMKVVKNTLARKALESFGEERGFEGLYDALKGPTAIMFADAGNVPAKVIKEFREDHEKPILKAAYIDSDIFVGDDQLESLKALKSKDELIGDVIVLLQSPVKNVIGSLQSGGNTLSNLLKALEQRAES